MGSSREESLRCPGGVGCSEDRHVEDRHSMTLERLREHLTRADGELETAQRFLGS